jgi:hypothetical protein
MGSLGLSGDSGFKSQAGFTLTCSSNGKAPDFGGYYNLVPIILAKITLLLVPQYE